VNISAKQTDDQRISRSSLIAGLFSDKVAKRLLHLSF
jgi:hypothetical protein